MSHSVEITIISGEDLRLNQKSIKKNAFVCVESDSSNICQTKMDAEGGSCPSWNEKLLLDVPLHASFIIAEVKCKTAMGVASVGMARIPVSDFLGGYVPENQQHLLSYRLWDSKCRRNGIINVSVRVKVPEMFPSAMSQQPVKGVPVSQHGSTAVATGIPAWLNCQTGF